MARGVKRSPELPQRSLPKRQRAEKHGDGRDPSSYLFKEAWRTLCAAGWYAKPPSRRSLDSRYRYVRPGGKANGDAGVDFVLGEESVVAEYMTLLQAAEGDLCGERQESMQPGNDECGISAQGEEEAGSCDGVPCGGPHDDLTDGGAAGGLADGALGRGDTASSALHCAIPAPDHATIRDGAAFAPELSHSQGGDGSHGAGRSVACGGGGRGAGRGDARGGGDGSHGAGRSVACGGGGRGAGRGDARGGGDIGRGVGRGGARGAGRGVVCGGGIDSGAGREVARQGGGDVGRGTGRGGARGDGGGAARADARVGGRDASRGGYTVASVAGRTGSRRGGRGPCVSATGVAQTPGGDVGGEAVADCGDGPAAATSNGGTDGLVVTLAIREDNTDLSECDGMIVSPDPGRSRRRAQDLSTVTELYLDTLVAFSPAREKWMKGKNYKGIGASYIIGRVCSSSTKKSKKKSDPLRFEVRWLDSQVQAHVESITVDLIQKGHHNYNLLTQEPHQIGWRSLCEETNDNSIAIDGDMEELEEAYVRFEPREFLPTNLQEVETIQNMHFDPNGQLEEPTDLFKRDDGSTTTVLRDEYRYMFEHSASSSFFAYLPLYFWQQVLHETNNYATLKQIPIAKPFTIQELMKFLGILFYMEVTVKGEYANYWGRQAEDGIFGAKGVDLEDVMPLKRFKQLRQALSFRSEVPEETIKRDPAARIRCLLNLLKVTGGKYVDLGRDVALDEASVACRSRFGRKMIVYNPRKPTGKYHFKLYMMCCASTWVAVNFRLHCEGHIADRLDSVTSPSEAHALEEELQDVATIRQHVLEVVRPIYNTQRVVNADNFYTSVQLLQALRVKGLRGRGTVRVNSKHFPKHVMLPAGECARGDYRQGVSVEHQMLAASWCDGSIVRVVSNADASVLSTVQRRIGAERMQFDAPLCVKHYNAYMQGVDRLDQTRARFSISDGHSFQKWHKKLAMALIDIGRCNAYLTRRMVQTELKSRDPHRDSMLDLVNELISGKWAEAPSNGRILYSTAALDPTIPVSTAPISPAFTSPMPCGSPKKICTAVSSKQMYLTANRKRRQCIICRWENRYPTEVTDFCVIHGVCLCKDIHATAPQPYFCPQLTWTCWEKYHRFYLPRRLFSAKGNLRKNSDLFKLKQSQQNTDTQSNQQRDMQPRQGRVVRSIVL